MKEKPERAVGTETILILPPEELVIVGVDTAHAKGEHPLFDERVFLPLDEHMLMSIETHGVVKPVFVRAAECGYEVVDGRRRVLHAREVNRRLSERGGCAPRAIRVMVEEGSDAHLFGISRLANRGAVSEHPIQTAEAARQLMNEGKSLQEIAAYLSVGVPMVKNYLNLLELDESVQTAVAQGEVTMSAALKLGVLGPDLQVEALDELLRGGNGTVAAAVAVRNRLCKSEEDASSVREPPPHRRIIQRLLARAKDLDLAHLSEDFWLGVRWSHGFVPSTRIRGLAKAVDIVKSGGRRRGCPPR